MDFGLGSRSVQGVAQTNIKTLKLRLFSPEAECKSRSNNPSLKRRPICSVGPEVKNCGSLSPIA